MRFVCAVAIGLLPFAAIGLEAGPPILISHTPDGSPTVGGLCYAPNLSRDGRFTGFTCMAYDVIPGEPGVGDAMLHDATTDSIIGLSYTDQGAWGDCGGTELGTCSSGAIRVADDGSEVVLQSGAPLVEGVLPPLPESGWPEVFLRNTVDQTTTWLTPPLQSPGSIESTAWDASVERREVLIDTPRNYTGGPDTNGSASDVFVVNWETREVELISATPTGEQAEGGSYAGIFSPDGRLVVFRSNASDLTGDNPQRMSNLFLRDRVLGTTRRLTFPWSGGEFTSQPNILFNTHITADNRYVFFASTGHEFTPDSNPNVPLAVYEIDLQTGQTRLISRGVNDEPLNGSVFGASFSDDGRYMAFESSATNVSEDPGPLPAAFVRDRLTGETINVSAALGTPPNPLPANVTISADGSTVAFAWPKWNATYPTLLDNQQIYAVRLRGDPLPVQAVPVPASSRFVLLVLVGLLGIGAAFAFRSRGAMRLSRGSRVQSTTRSARSGK